MTTESPKLSRPRITAPPRPRARRASTEPVLLPATEGEVAPDFELYRQRMNAIGSTLSAVFVGMDSAEADVWGRGIYLKLVGKLCEALDSDDLTLEDLHALSKMISEQRRAHSRALEVQRRLRAGRRRRGDGDRSGEGELPDHDAEEDSGLASTRKLPPHFGAVVQEIYGVQVDPSPAPS